MVYAVLASRSRGDSAELQRADGTWYLDNDFADFLVTVEVNGLQHYEQTLREADDFHRAVLQIAGASSSISARTRCGTQLPQMHVVASQRRYGVRTATEP